jgi:hypothetical protein
MFDMKKHFLTRGGCKMTEKCYYLKDENGDFVWDGSIILVTGKYYYTPYSALVGGCRWYDTYETAEKFLKKLQQKNLLAGLSHKFKIICL